MIRTAQAELADRSAPPVYMKVGEEQRRVARDGKAYTRQEFLEWYGKAGKGIFHRSSVAKDQESEQAKQKVNKIPKELQSKESHDKADKPKATQASVDHDFFLHWKFYPCPVCRSVKDSFLNEAGIPCFECRGERRPVPLAQELFKQEDPGFVYQ